MEFSLSHEDLSSEDGDETGCTDNNGLPSVIGSPHIEHGEDFVILLPPPSQTRHSLLETKDMATDALGQGFRLLGSGLAQVLSGCGRCFSLAWASARQRRADAVERKRMAKEKERSSLSHRLLGSIDPEIQRAIEQLEVSLAEHQAISQAKESHLNALISKARRHDRSVSRESLKAAIRSLDIAQTNELRIRQQLDEIEGMVGQISITKATHVTSGVMKKLSQHGRAIHRQWELDGGKHALEETMDSLEESVALGAAVQDDIQQSSETMFVHASRANAGERNALRYVSPAFASALVEVDIEERLNEILSGGDSPPPQGDANPSTNHTSALIREGRPSQQPPGQHHIHVSAPKSSMTSSSRHGHDGDGVLLAGRERAMMESVSPRINKMSQEEHLVLERGVPHPTTDIQWKSSRNAHLAHKRDTQGGREEAKIPQMAT